MGSPPPGFLSPDPLDFLSPGLSAVPSIHYVSFCFMCCKIIQHFATGRASTRAFDVLGWRALQVCRRGPLRPARAPPKLVNRLFSGSLLWFFAPLGLASLLSTGPTRCRFRASQQVSLVRRSIRKPSARGGASKKRKIDSSPVESAVPDSCRGESRTRQRNRRPPTGARPWRKP
jgi:hypothetical protein